MAAAAHQCSAGASGPMLTRCMNDAGMGELALSSIIMATVIWAISLLALRQHQS